MMSKTFKGPDSGRLDTHWSRILHCNVFAARVNDSSAGMAREVRPSIMTAAIVVGIYVATYVAIAGVIHVLGSPDAAAAIVTVAANDPTTSADGRAACPTIVFAQPRDARMRDDHATAH